MAIQQELFKTVPQSRFSLLSKEELVEYIQLQQKFNETLLKDNERLRALNNELAERSLFIDEKYITIKNKLFGKSSEREPSKESREKAGTQGKKKKVQLPSLRYPDAPLIERDINFDTPPHCELCSSVMKDSGMTEDSEHLTVIPAQYIVVLQKRHKYRCDTCHGPLVTAPCPPRITPGGGFSDEMSIDVAMSKYCDLIPVERYASIAGRAGLEDLPTHSLIEQTHNLADFAEGAYDKIKEELLAEKVLHADETPHRMLEGDEKSKWYLWGFSSKTANYFDIRDTRSGDIASEFLNNSKCEYLVSDVFSGYGKSVRVTNEERAKMNLPTIRNIYCNAHARRKFKEAENNFPDEARFFIDGYKEIYYLEDSARGQPPDIVLGARQKMAPLFENMKNRAIANYSTYSSKSSIAVAMSYFLKNYTALTAFIQNSELPIDNNPQERLLRNPVIGRKTWYGTHSKRGARTAAILFTLVESCKLNKINPRKYFKSLVLALHEGKTPFTPHKFKQTSL